MLSFIVVVFNSNFCIMLVMYLLHFLLTLVVHSGISSVISVPAALLFEFCYPGKGLKSLWRSLRGIIRCVQVKVALFARSLNLAF